MSAAGRMTSTAGMASASGETATAAKSSRIAGARYGIIVIAPWIPVGPVSPAGSVIDHRAGIADRSDDGREDGQRNDQQDDQDQDGRE